MRHAAGEGPVDGRAEVIHTHLTLTGGERQRMLRAVSNEGVAS